jgi:hypothetical protein
MATTTTINPSLDLTKVIPRTLAECEAIIEAGLNGFVEAGRALAEIKEYKLYKDGRIGSTWKSYCKERWKMSSAQADRLINSALIVSRLQISKKVPIGTFPQSECVTRPLTQLPQGDIEAAWMEAVKEAGGKQPTAAIVQKVVDKRNFNRETDRRAEAKSKRAQRESKKENEKKASLSTQTSTQQAPKEAPSGVKAGNYKEYAVQTRDTLERIIIITTEAREEADEVDREWFNEIIRFLRQLQDLVLLAGIPK